MSLKKYGIIGAATLGMTAAIVFFIRLPEFLPAHGPRIEGLAFGKDNFRKHACSIFLANGGSIIDPHEGALPSPGLRYVLHARCRKGGYMQILVAQGAEASRFYDLPVGPWSDSQALKTESQDLVGILMPEGGVTIQYSYTTERLTPPQKSALDAAPSWTGRGSGLLWLREAVVMPSVAPPGASPSP